MPVTINPNVNPNTLSISKAQAVLFKSSKWILAFWIIRSIISSSIVIANYFPLQHTFFQQLLAFNYWFTPISVIIILLISIYTIIENTSFWDSPSKLSTVHDKYAEINQLKDNLVNPKKRKLLIDETLKNGYLEKLRISLEEEYIFLDSELTLQKMATHLGISQHQLSSLINAEFNENFNQYINTHRIMVAKTILKDPKHKDITMLAVAIDCGFKSESVFYTAFKRNTGITPNQYKITLL
jgi:AraC-like DNA-binding protein